MVGSSTAGVEPPHVEHAKFLGMDAHTGAMYASIVVGLAGIAIAFLLHYVGRRTAAVSKADSIRLGAVQNPLIPVLREREVGFITAQVGTDVLIVPSTWRG